MLKHCYFRSSTDEADFQPPDGWDFSIYSLEPRDFRYAKTFLPVSSRINITRYDFRSRVRFNAGMRAGGLQINFIDSYSTARSRLQGLGRINSIVMITLPGYDWDGISDVGALGIEVNFDASAAGEILSEYTSSALAAYASAFGTNRSLVFLPSPAALSLRALLEDFLRNFDRSSGLADTCQGSLTNHRMALASFGDTPRLNDQTFTEMARTVIDGVASHMRVGERLSSHQRRDLAQLAEKALWEDIRMLSGDPVSLDELCDRLQASRRTLQLALQEQFGLSFKALQRVVLLQKIRRMFRSGQLPSVTAAGTHFYRGQFGRLSRDYMTLFGVLPSSDLTAGKEARRATAESG